MYDDHIYDEGDGFVCWCGERHEELIPVIQWLNDEERAVFDQVPGETSLERLRYLLSLYGGDVQRQRERMQELVELGLWDAEANK